MNRKLYLAYGSNLNVNQMLMRCPDAVKIGASILAGYRLVFRGGRRLSGVLDIEPADGQSIPVGVWAISPEDEENLDVYEGFPRLYTKQIFRLPVKGQTVTAMAYIMTRKLPVSAPNKLYLRVCAEGYRDFDFDQEPLIRAALEAGAKI